MRGLLCAGALPAVGLALHLVLVPGAAVAATAEEEAAPPQILTSDLATVHRTRGEEMAVRFVIVDADRVVRVEIDGEPADITPATLVTVARTIALPERRTIVEVAATDEAGHTRRKRYAIIRTDLAPARELSPFGQAHLRYEVDTNPSRDISSPVSISGVDTSGVVPDSEQDDVRTVASATVGARYGPWAAYAGALVTRYRKAANEAFEYEAVYLGGGYRQGFPGFQVGYALADLNLGGFDYSQEHTVSVGWLFQPESGEGRRWHLFGLDTTYKDFARDEQDDGGQAAVKWIYSSRDSEAQDAFRSEVALGTVTEGFEATDYRFVGGDADWLFRWTSGFRLDAGLGLEYRDFPEAEPQSTESRLGDTRVDNLFRFSTAAGYQFTPGLAALLSYRYLFNLSNDAPYERQIYGVAARGRF